VAWEPEPMLDIGSGLSAREMDVIEDRLSVIRTWIKFMGLGELEVPPPLFLSHCPCRSLRCAYVSFLLLFVVMCVARGPCRRLAGYVMLDVTGCPQAATKALYESWERDGRFAGIAAEGVSRAQWVCV
jgi:hypothetical protein